MPSTSRLFEKVLYDQLYDYFAKNKLLGDEQCGFRSLHSTAIALSQCTNDWIINIDRGDMSNVVFLDIKKAFDTVDHEILLKKLNKYGLYNDELKFFESYLSNHRQCCSVNGLTSTLKPILCGLPQDSILGPLLFIIYMNDLPECIWDGRVTMYADDTSLSNKGKTIEDIENKLLCKLIPDLSRICSWLQVNKLNLNPIKTEFMIIGTRQNILKIRNLLAIKVDGNLIRRVHRTRYLGIIIDDNLSWKDQVDHIATKIKRNLGAMKRVANDIPEKYMNILYRTLIQPHLRYCNTVWRYCNETSLNRLQTLQNRAARIVTGKAYADADHPVLLSNLNWLNIRELFKYETLSMMYKAEQNLLPESTVSMFDKLDQNSTHQTRAVTNGNYNIPRSKTENSKSAIACAGPVTWNGLPTELRKAQSLDSFQQK